MSMLDETTTGTDAARAMRVGVARESVWLFAGYALTAAVGFVFWIVAARAVPPATLGTDAGLLSLVTATAALSSSGLGSALVVMLGRPGAARLLRRAVVLTVAVAAVLGSGAGALAHAFIVPDAPVLVVVPVIAVCCVSWALFTLQGQAVVGLGHAPVTLLVNGPVNLGKLALVSLAAGLSLAVPHTVLAATMAPAVVAVIVVAVFVLPRMARRQDARTAVAPVETVAEHIGFAQYVVRDTAAIGLTLGVGLSLAFLVTVLAGPVSGAEFSIAYQFSVVLDLVTVSVATALGRGASTRSELRTAGIGLWKRTVVVVAVAAAVATAASPIVYGLMGPSYDPGVGATIVALLGAACIARCAYELWTGLLRARRHVGRIVVWNALGAVIVLAGVFLLAPRGGAVGAAIAVAAGAAVYGAVGIVGLVAEARTEAVR